ncbi:MAG: superoxide dismutase [Mariniphaga sp.]
MTTEQNSRRDFFKKASLSGIALFVSSRFSFAAKASSPVGVSLDQVISKLAEYQLTGQSKQNPLPYGYADLEPSVDTKTMEIHYSKHHAAYTKNMNEMSTAANTGSKPLFQLFAEIDKYPVPLKNNAGGFYNHLLFWTILAPAAGQVPEGKLLAAITESFGSFDKFKEIFSNAGKKQFGSGWAWLSVDEHAKLVVSATANQDNPLMSTTEVKGIPVLALDVWEHAYYLQYQNRRPEYVEAFWKIVNWKEVSRRYDEALLAIK